MEKKESWFKTLPIGVKIIIVVGCIFWLLVIIATISDTDDNSTNNQTNNEQTTTETKNTNNVKENKKKDKEEYTTDKAFEFDNLEITIGSNYEFTTIDNQFSDEYGKDVIKLPITVKNLKDETHSLNMFSYSVFGSQGTELSTSISTYFDDGVDEAGDLRPEASHSKYIYFLYDGDGTYTIEFDDWVNKIDINIEIKK